MLFMSFTSLEWLGEMSFILLIINTHTHSDIDGRTNTISFAYYRLRTDHSRRRTGRMTMRVSSRSERWCMRLSLLSWIGIEDEQFLLSEEAPAGAILLWTVSMLGIRRGEPLMDVTEMTPVSTYNTENILPENRLQAKRTRDLRRWTLAGRCCPFGIDFLENLCSFVEMFPSMQQRSIGVENRMRRLFAELIARRQLAVHVRRFEHRQEEHAGWLNVTLFDIIRNKMLNQTYDRRERTVKRSNRISCLHLERSDFETTDGPTTEWFALPWDRWVIANNALIPL